MLRWDNSKPWVVAELFSLGFHQDRPYQAKVRASSPVLMLLGPVLLWEGGSSLTDEAGNGQNQFYYSLHGMMIWWPMNCNPGWMALGGSTGYSAQYGPSGSMAQGHKHAHRCHSRPQASPWHSVVTWTMDIVTDPDYSWVTDPDLTLDCSSGPNISMTTGGSTGHPSMTTPTLFGPQTLTWPQVVAQTTVLYMVFGSHEHHRQSHLW